MSLFDRLRRIVKAQVLPHRAERERPAYESSAGEHDAERGPSRQRTRTPQMPDDVRRRLRDLYRDDILRLEDLIDRDLSHWLAPSSSS